MVVVTRLIDSLNRVSGCTGCQVESESSFVTCFTRLASEHLMQAGSSPTSKIGEVLAIMMLNNANLGYCPVPRYSRLTLLKVLKLESWETTHLKIKTAIT